MDNFEKNIVFDVTIHGMSHDGRGVGRLESGITAFVQGAVTGQKVKAQVMSVKKRMIEALCVEVCEKSPYEIKPYCMHALEVLAVTPSDYSLESVDTLQSNACGGCPFMALSYDRQLHEKMIFVRNALVRIGHFDTFKELDVSVQEDASKDQVIENNVFNKKVKNIRMPAIDRLLPILSPRDLPHYDADNSEKNLTSFRNKMEFAFKVTPLEKTFLAKNSVYTTKIGLKKRASHDIIEVTACKLQKSISMDIVEAVRSYCKNKELAFLRYLVVRTPSTGKVTVELITWPLAKEKKLAQKEAKTILDMAKTVLAVNGENGTVDGFIHSVRQNKLDIAYGERIMREWGETSLTENLKLISEKKTHSLLLGNKAFFQVNTSMTNILYSVIYAFASHVLAEKNNTIWDIYSGVGSISSCLAPLTKENKKSYYSIGVLDKKTLNTLCPVDEKKLNSDKLKSKKILSPQLFGMESVSSACALARKNTEKYKGIFETADAKYLGQYLKKYTAPDLIVLDPPRAGLEEATINALLKNSIQNCIMVSCNPSTLARDLDLLSEKYDLCAVQPVDLFPHGAHVECVALLRRRYV